MLRRWGPKTLLVAGICASALLVPWALLVHKLIHASPVISSARPASIVWNGTVFSSREQLERWLHSRGASYAEWAARHPADRKILEPDAKAPARRPTSAAGGSTASPSQRSKAASSTPTAAQNPQGARLGSDSGTSLAWLKLALVTLAALAMLAGLLPGFVPVPRGALAVQWLNASRRAYLFAVGFSVCVGVLIAGFQL